MLGNKFKTTTNNNGVLRLVQRMLLFSLIVFCLVAVGESKDIFTLSDKLLAAAEKKYGEMAKRRLLAWQSLIREDSGTTDLEKLEKVNTFFNRIQFVDDIIHWKKKDYWATPVEFLTTGAGDCEDFSLAKYFTLKALGVKESKLNMTYVKAVRLNQAHMVVTYHEKPDSIPLVLDNLISEILPATKRKDLIPVYSFNGAGLWLAKSRGKGKKVGGSEKLKRWTDLLSRMPDGLN